MDGRGRRRVEEAGNKIQDEKLETDSRGIRGKIGYYRIPNNTRIKSD